MSDTQQNQPSLFARVRDRVEQAASRVRFELSFPSREAREYFNGTGTRAEAKATVERIKERQSSNVAEVRSVRPAQNVQAVAYWQPSNGISPPIKPTQKAGLSM